MLLGAVGILVLLLAFALLAAEVFEGDTQAFDNRVLTALRRVDNRSIPIGPPWLRAGAIDITALGSPTVLGLATLAVCGFLLLQRMARTATFVFIATTGGWFLNETLKEVFQRARPAIVPHLQTVMTLSFPSGHAMNSAAVYLTLGALTMRLADRRVTKLYCMAVGDAPDLSGRHEPHLPGRSLSDRRPRRVAAGDDVGAGLLDRGTPHRAERGPAARTNRRLTVVRRNRSPCARKPHTAETQRVPRRNVVGRCLEIG